jgi:5-methylcytosine-specific restriction enzyme A
MPNRTPYLSPDIEPRKVLNPITTEEERERRAFYSSKRWQKHRKAFLAIHPLCAHCQAKGRITAARIVHHKVERLADPKLAWDWSNFEALCSPCHTEHHNAHRRSRSV